MTGSTSKSLYLHVLDFMEPK